MSDLECQVCNVNHCAFGFIQYVTTNQKRQGGRCKALSGRIKRRMTAQLSETVFEAVRHAIITWQFPPGHELSEQALADRFGLGKAPVRSALARLRQEGWVISTARRGHRVAALTKADVADVFAFRELLEPEAMRLAAGRVNEARLLGHLERCAAAYDLADSEAKEKFLIAHRDFHIDIAFSSGSIRLGNALEKLHNEFLRILYPTVSVKERSSEWMQGHLKIVTALVHGDGMAAASLSQAGIRRSRAATLQAFEEAIVITTNVQSVFHIS